MLQLHDYQREAVRHLRSNPRACLFLDMGEMRSYGPHPDKCVVGSTP